MSDASTVQCVSPALGFVAAVCSAFANGSFAAFYKLKRVQDCGIDPVLFNLYVSVGVIISSWIPVMFFSLMKKDVAFEPVALISGLLLVLANQSAFLAVPRVGLSLGQGVWSGTAIIVSVVWGIVFFDEVPRSTALLAVSVAMLLIAVLGIAFCEAIATRLCHEKPRTTAAVEYQASLLSDAESPEDEETLPPASPPKPSASYKPMPLRQRQVGFVCALLVGLFGGSILLPSHYLSSASTVNGLGIMPSFSVGVLLACPFPLLITKLASPAPRTLEPHARAALLPGLLSGTVWNISNMASVLAIQGIGYGIGYTFLQCGVFISGLWGIFAFKELSGKPVLVFFLSALLLLGGLVVLAFFGPKKTLSC